MCPPLSPVCPISSSLLQIRSSLVSVSYLVPVVHQALDHFLLGDVPVVVLVQFVENHRELLHLLKLQVLKRLAQHLPLQAVEAPDRLKLLDLNKAIREEGWVGFGGKGR